MAEDIWFNLTKEFEKDLLHIYQSLCDNLAQKLDSLERELEKLCSQTQYEPMLNIVNETVDLFNDDTYSMADEAFGAWSDGQYSFSANAKMLVLGDVAIETAQQIEQSIKGLFEGFWSSRPLGKGINLDTSSPRIKQSDFDELKDIYTRFSLEVEDINEKIINQIKEQGYDDPTYNVVIPAIIAITKPINRWFEKAINSLSVPEKFGLDTRTAIREMDLDWQLDNPAIALEGYYEATKVFVEKNHNNKMLDEERSAREKELESKRAELKSAQSKLSDMGERKSSDVEGNIRGIKEKALDEVEEETRIFESRVNELGEEKERDLHSNDSWLEEELNKILGDNTDVDKELSEMEKKALEFEISRRQFIIASDKRINDFEDAITEEKLSCQNDVGELKEEQDRVYYSYEDDINSLTNQIDSINREYQPIIRNCQNNLQEKIAIRDEELEDLHAEKERETQNAINEKTEYEREFQNTRRDFDERIRIARIQQKPTTRMENSRDTRLRDIKDKIYKIDKRISKKIASIDQKIENVRNKHANIVEKAEDELNSVIQKRDIELEGPTRDHDALIAERSGKINELQSQIDQRENKSNLTISQNQANLQAEKKAQNDNNAKIDQQIIDFVMSGDTCFSDVLDEQYAPFIALQGRINIWGDMLPTIISKDYSSKYQKTHEKQKRLLASKSYQELQNELMAANKYNDKLSLFTKNRKTFCISGGLLGVVGLILLVVVWGVMQEPVGLWGCALVLLGIVMVLLSIAMTNIDFSKICRYISLAADYKDFPSISMKSSEIAQNRELAKMKGMGEKLYSAYRGKAEVQEKHDAKDADIRADYERNIKLIKKEFDNKKAQIERERDAEIKRIREKANRDEKNFSNEKEELENQASELTKRINGLRDRVYDLEKMIDANNRFIDNFENSYKLFNKRLDDEKWIAPMNYTHGRLSDLLYVIPENGEEDECNHRKVYRIKHNKKPIVVNYDLANVNEDRVEEINKVIHDLMFDLMYSIYRVNSKDTYAQYVVDGMAATNDLKNNSVKNAFNIVEVVGKIENIKGRIKSFSMQRERLTEKGVTIDQINENNFVEGERPETYNILYIIFRPDERKNKLDEEIRMLIPECDKYGLLPVFICEKETWEREIQEKESIYRDIKGRANSEILVFDGEKYSFA